jgi:cysteinyl-tRNA synthetase
MKHLGETFDIHGGGMDLIFPHHENEIAQSCGATGKEFARYWVHNGFVQINQEKMSKSLGNFFTIREIFEKSNWPEAETGEMLRYFLLGTHYRSPLDFSDKSIEEAKNALNGFYDLFMRLKESEHRATADKGLIEAIERCKVAFRAAMDDDFNTPVAIAALQGMRSGVNKLLDQGLSSEARKIARNEFHALGKVLGLFQLEQWQFGQKPIGQTVGMENPSSPRSRVMEVSQPGPPLPLRAQQSTVPALTDEEIEGKRIERDEARKQKNFKKADEIRQFLASRGIAIEDKPDGTSRWKR